MTYRHQPAAPVAKTLGHREVFLHLPVPPRSVLCGSGRMRRGSSRTLAGARRPALRAPARDDSSRARHASEGRSGPPKETGRAPAVRARHPRATKRSRAPARTIAASVGRSRSRNTRPPPLGEQQAASREPSLTNGSSRRMTSVTPATPSAASDACVAAATAFGSRLPRGGLDRPPDVGPGLLPVPPDGCRCLRQAESGQDSGPSSHGTEFRARHARNALTPRRRRASPASAHPPAASS